MWALHQLKASQDGRHERQSPSGSSSPFTESELQQFPVLSRRNFWCIQRHQATAHHYDLRLHLNGGLLSWAIPKGLLGMSKDAEPARLAIQTEIHPVSYAIHEGREPLSRTGKPRGTLLWDVGYYFVDDIHTYDAESPESPSTDGTDAKDPGLFEERKLESAMGRIRDGQATSFHFFLRGGAKMTDHAFILVRTADSGGQPRQGKPSWLLRLPKGVHGYPWDVNGEDGYEHGRSVKTGRTMDQVCMQQCR